MRHIQTYLDANPNADPDTEDLVTYLRKTVRREYSRMKLEDLHHAVESLILELVPPLQAPADSNKIAMAGLPAKRKSTTSTPKAKRKT